MTENLDGALKRLGELIALRQQLTSTDELICVCADCNKLRDDQGNWQEIDVDLKNIDFELTHGFCPDCLSQRNIEVEDFIRANQNTQ